MGESRFWGSLNHSFLGSRGTPRRLGGGFRRGALSRGRVGRMESLEPRRLLAGDPVITEFMARNDGFLEDGDGKSPDWIEIQNIGDAAVDLAGYRLTDKPDNLSRWAFPSVVVEPGEYLVVFASGQEQDDYVDAEGNLHTNFALSADGEFLGLVSPSGSLVSQFGDSQTAYPAQIRNVSYGGAQQELIFDGQSEAMYWVPTDASVDTEWMNLDFDAAAHGFESGFAALGYENDASNNLSFSPQIITPLPQASGAVYARVEFDVPDSSVVDRLELHMKYDDGFVAYLNGVRIFASNTPDDVDASSRASVRRADFSSREYVVFDISDHVPLLDDGRNVMAFHAMVHEVDFIDMLLVPKLVATANSPDSKVGYMTSPTPGTPNAFRESVYSGVAGDVSIDVEAGFYDAPFFANIASLTPNAEVRYTTDGSPPTVAHGLLYDGPISIDTTTTLRAAAFIDDYVPSNVATRSYLFLEDVIRQSSVQPGLPTVWRQPSGEFAADYAMDSRIVNNPAYRDDIVDGLRSIPTISITMHPDDFLGPDGLYMNADGHGATAERPVSVEIINPDGSLGIRVNAGLRNHGNSTRSLGVTMKRSFRLVFSPKYGPRKLEYPLFADAPVERFDNIVLHAGKMPDDTQLLRNTFGRDTNRAMGNVDAQATFVHLYVNGLYWGMYNPFERPDAEFGEEYFGGSEDDYDSVLNHTDRTDGDTLRYLASWRSLRTGLETQEEYEEFRRKIDLNSLFDVLLTNQYTAHREFEIRALGSRVGDSNFRFFVHDVDEGGMDMVETFKNPGAFLPYGDSLEGIVAHPELRMYYADRAHKHLFNGGALTPEVASERWENRYEEIFTAVIGETARWGDGRFRGAVPRPTFHRNLQMAESQEFLTETFFPQRTDVVISQLRGLGIYPEIDAPQFNQHGGGVPAGFELLMSHPNETGTILYTIDGSDPRQFGGQANPGAQIYDGSPIPVDEGTVIKSRVLSGEEWSALNEAEFIVTSGDLNEDGQVTGDDIDAVCSGIHDRNLQFDLNSDGVVTQDDLTYFVQTILGTHVGDVNLDGQFDSGDLTQLLATGEYEDGIVGNSSWTDGDWDCDREFTSSDLVLAMRAGTFGSAAPLLAFSSLKGVASRIDGESWVGAERTTSAVQTHDADPSRGFDSTESTRQRVDLVEPVMAFTDQESSRGRKDAWIRDTLFQQDGHVEELLDASYSDRQERSELAIWTP